MNNFYIFLRNVSSTHVWKESSKIDEAHSNLNKIDDNYLVLKLLETLIRCWLDEVLYFFIYRNKLVLSWIALGIVPQMLIES